MRLLWISCLLVGSITCLPAQEPGQGGEEAYPRGWNLGSWVSGPGSPDPAVTTGPVVSKPDQQFQQVQYVYGGSPGVYNPQNPDGNPDGPFFTDTSGMNPVYNFNSRSRYRRGRVMFGQGRYVPLDTLYRYNHPGHQEYQNPGYPVYKYPGYPGQQSQQTVVKGY